MMKRLATILVTVISVVMLMTAVSFAADKDITKKVDGYTNSYVDYITGEPVTNVVDLYTIKIPKGTKEVTLKFDKEYLVYNYDGNPGEYLAGAVSDPAAGTNAVKVKVDSQRENYDGTTEPADGKIDFIQVQTPYDESWNSTLLYAITFEYVNAPLDKTTYTYTGKAFKPETKNLTSKIKYSNNKKAGKAKALATFTGAANGFTYTVAKDYSFKIKKAKNPMKVTKSTKSVKKCTLMRNGKKVISPIKVVNAKGKVTYTKVKGCKNLKVDKKTGKITANKGMGKRAHYVTVKVKASGGKNYKASSETVKVKVNVI